MAFTTGKVKNAVGGVGVVMEVGAFSWLGVLGPVGEMILSMGLLPLGLNTDGVWTCGKENGVWGVWNGDESERVELWVEPGDVAWV